MRTHKPDAVEPDPIRGQIEAAVDGQRTLVEHEPDPALRDTEQVPLLEEGGVEAFIRREVLPYTPDAWYVPGSVKTGCEISFHAPLLQATAPAPLGRDTGGHPGAGTGDGGPAGGDCTGNRQRSTLVRIQSVRLNNYKRFTSLTLTNIPEPTRLVVLFGPNGCGKSSVFDAFLAKSQAQRNNYALQGQFADYYQKDSSSEAALRSISQVARKIDISFYGKEPEPDHWPGVFCIRTAYRNEADFQLETLGPVAPSAETPRFARIIDQDRAVSDNYSRLSWKRMADLDGDEPGTTTFEQYRKRVFARASRLHGETVCRSTSHPTGLWRYTDDGRISIRQGTAPTFIIRTCLLEKRRHLTCCWICLSSDSSTETPFTALMNQRPIPPQPCMASYWKSCWT